MSWAAQALAPGTYEVSAKSPSVVAQVVINDRSAVGTYDPSWSSVSGTVTLTTVTPESLVGEFDVTLVARDGGTSSLAGRFAAPGCR